jgi:NDP-sugar pyrophosphorylase family protein
VRFEQGRILAYDKMARHPDMHHIDYGLSVFRAEAFGGYAKDQPLDLAMVMQDLLARDQLAGYEVASRFYEIGSPAGLAALETLLSQENKNAGAP